MAKAIKVKCLATQTCKMSYHELKDNIFQLLFQTETFGGGAKQLYSNIFNDFPNQNFALFHKDTQKTLRFNV